MDPFPAHVLGQLSNLKNLADQQLNPSFNDHRPTLYVQTQHRLKTEQIQGLIDAYKNGASTSCLTKEYGIHRTTLWAHLDRAEVSGRPAKRKLTNTQVRWAADQSRLGSHSK